MSFRTERQRSEESLRPYVKKVDSAGEEANLLFEGGDSLINESCPFLQGSRDSSLRWLSVRNDICAWVEM